MQDTKGCIVKIGAFNQTSDKLTIFDPYFNHNESPFTEYLGLVITGASKGIWNAYLTILDSHKSKNAELTVIHFMVDVPDFDFVTADWTLIGNITVNSGQAGIYDLKYHNNNAQNNNTHNVEIVSNGIVSCSGFGNGQYNVFYLTKDNLVVGIKIVFIDSK